ncbi:RNA polymerase sigma factor [Actinoplanes sp. GCM10030250]|uniref:RNA polymerase sigma factor n=1 Tax=Actinoplanes sp. GCM10030250 TaxID=3273376 RepID=UPI00361BE9C5
MPVASPNEGAPRARPDAPVGTSGDHQDGAAAAPEPWRMGPELTAFFKQEMPGMVKFAWARLGTRQDGEDAACNAMFELARRWDKIDKPRAYVWQVLRNEIKKMSAAAGRTIAYPPDVMAELAGAAADGDFDDQQGTQWVNEHLASLPPTQHDVMHLRVVNGLNIEETARFLSKSKDTVRQHHAQARKTLKSRMPRRPGSGTAGKDGQ